MRDEENPDSVQATNQAPLLARVRSGVLINLVSLTSIRLIAIARSIVLARLLSPDDYGLFGMCAITLGALSALTNLGIDASLLVSGDSKEEIRSQLNTLWTAELIRRLVITLLLLAAIYPTAYFYNEPSLMNLLPFVSLVPLVEGLRNIGFVIDRKQVNFRNIVYLEQATNIVSTVIMIALAVVMKSVWALVLGQLLSSVAGAALSYWLHPYRPGFEINRAALASMINYGKYGFVLSVGAYITTTADNIFVGKMLKATNLGIYVLAYGLASLPVEAIGNVLNAVMFPAFAEIGTREQSRLESAFAKTLRVGLIISLLSAVPMAIVADEIVILLYGEKWALAGPILRILALVGFFRSFINIISPFLLSQHGPRPQARAKAVETVIFLLLLYPLINYRGLAGAAIAGGIIYILSAVNRLLLVRMFNRSAFYKASQILGVALIAGLSGLICGAFVLTIVEGTLMRLFAGLSISVSAMLAVFVLMQPEIKRDLKALWKSVRSR